MVSVTTNHRVHLRLEGNLQFIALTEALARCTWTSIGWSARLQCQARCTTHCQQDMAQLLKKNICPCT